MNTLYQCDEASKGGPTNDTDDRAQIKINYIHIGKGSLSKYSI